MKEIIFNFNMLCPFCGVNIVQHNGKKYISKEHVPPESIFIDKMDASGLIKIPCCTHCNNGTSKYDEQFKYLLSMQLGI